MAEHVDWVTAVSAGIIVVLITIVVRFGFTTLSRIEATLKSVEANLLDRLSRIETRVHMDMFNFNKRLGRVEGFLQSRGYREKEDDELDAGRPNGK